MAEYVVGLDAGSTMTKAVLFDRQGRELGSERRRNPIQFPAPGHTERDAPRMWRDAADAVNSLLEKTGVRAGDIAAIATCGYGAGLYLVDARGHTVRPGIMSTDARAQGLLREWTSDGRADAAGRCVQQRLWTGQPAPLLGWLQRHEPDSLRRTHRIVFCKDYLRAQLCGDVSTDPTDAGLGGLIDVTTGEYPAEFYERLGLDAWRDKLPPIGASTAVAGRVSEAAAELTGLLAGTPVVRGVVDVVSAALASGVADPTQLSVVAGTFSINSSLHPAPRLDTLPMLQMPYPVGGYSLATEGAPTSASNFEWYCKAILGPVLAAAAESTGHTIYEVCGDRVASAMDRPNDILFFPFLFGGPGGAPAGFVGLQALHDGADIVRAIFEGIAFAHRLDVDALRGGRDAAPLQTIRLTGGAARNPLWAQMFADVLGLPVELTDGSELGARGTAMAAAIGIGWHADWTHAQREMVRVVRRLEPQPDRQAAYERKYRRFQRHAQALAALHAEDAALGSAS